MKSWTPAFWSAPFLIFMLRTIESKLVPEYNLKALDDYEVIKDNYKILYKEHLYGLKVQIDTFVNQNELVLFETYTKLAEMLNNTKIDTSGEFVEIKYKLLSQLLENRDDVMQIYVTLRHKINEIAYKVISFIQNNHVDRNSMYFLEYTMEQMLRQCKTAVPHNKHLNILAGMPALPYLFLHQGEYSR